MVARCVNCGAENLDQAKFCSSCGRSIAVIPSISSTGIRTCVSCGRTIDWDVSHCPYCGHDFRLPRPGPSQLAQPPKTKNNTALIVAIVVIVVVVVLVGALAAIASISVPKADLRAQLTYSASNDYLGLGSGGTIEVSGTIYNYGQADGGGTVQLHIYDGTSWHDYSVSTGVVAAELFVPFDWSVHYDSLDTSTCQVQYTLTTG